MTGFTNGPSSSPAPDESLVVKVARLSADLLEAARALGEPSVIASAEAAAFRAAVVLAAALQASDGDP